MNHQQWSARIHLENVAHELRGFFLLGQFSTFTHACTNAWKILLLRQSKEIANNVDGGLFLHGNSNAILGVASIMVRDAMKPKIDLLLKNVKFICYLYPTGSSVVSTHSPLGMFVVPHVKHGSIKNRSTLWTVRFQTRWLSRCAHGNAPVLLYIVRWITHERSAHTVRTIWGP